LVALYQLAAHRNSHRVSAVNLNMPTGMEERFKEEVRAVDSFLYAAEICRQLVEVHWGRSDELSVWRNGVQT